MYETIKQYKYKTLHMALTSQGANKKIQNSARHTNVTNCQENSYRPERETQEWQKEKNIQTEHMQNSVKKNQTQHIQNRAQNTNLNKKT